MAHSNSSKQRTFFLTKKFFIFLGVVFIIAIIFIYYLYYSLYHPSSNDAYLRADIVVIHPQVSGEIDDIFIKNNMFIKKNTPILKINRKKYAATLALQNALLVQQRAVLSNAEKKYKRIEQLYKDKSISEEIYDNTLSNYHQIKAAVLAQEARVNLAQQDVNDTLIMAPVQGYITNFSFFVGGSLTPDDSIYLVKTQGAWWIDAQFKEGQLRHIHIGAPVKITLDAYPAHPLQGVVDTISAATATSFSLLPSENISDNFIKVTQRVLVKIKVLTPYSDMQPYRSGLSATVTVN